MTLQHLPEVLQRIQLYLAYSLSRHTNFLTDLLQRRTPASVQTEAALNNRALLVIEFTNPSVDDVIDVVPLRASGRFGRTLCQQAIDGAIAIFVTTVGTQRHSLMQSDKSLDVRSATLKVVGQFLDRRRMTILLLQATPCAQTAIDVLHDVYRQANSARLVHDAALYVLSYPPGCIR